MPDDMTADEWNAHHPIGTVVNAWPGTRDGGACLRTRTRSKAWTLGDGAAVVAVKGYPGGISLAHIEPVSRDVPPDLTAELVETLHRAWHPAPNACRGADCHDRRRAVDTVDILGPVIAAHLVDEIEEARLNLAEWDGTC